MSLTKTELLTKTERRYRDVALPGGGSIRIQSLTERERSRIETSMIGKDGKIDRNKLGESRLKQIAACVVDDDGVVMFPGEGWRELERLDSSITGAIYSACLAHVGYEDEEVEDLVGKSEETLA